jgi:predicted RNase H-like HicB family nuclease
MDWKSGSNCWYNNVGRSFDQLERSSRLMKFTITLDRDEDGVWVAECPSIPGCISQGNTREEAVENIKDAIKNCLIVRAERGMPLTIETQMVEVFA